MNGTAKLRVCLVQNVIGGNVSRGLGAQAAFPSWSRADISCAGPRLVEGEWKDVAKWLGGE